MGWGEGNDADQRRGRGRRHNKRRKRGGSQPAAGRRTEPHGADSAPDAAALAAALPPALPPEAGAIPIDGSLLEGGGQILRVAAALAAVLGRAVHVSNIRANRSKPGLRPQHLTGLKLISDMTNGTLNGGHVGSCEIDLSSAGPPRAGAYTADTGTAGSCTLLAQAALPCAVFASPAVGAPDARVRMTLQGGTDADLAPPVGYMQQVLLPTLREHFGVRVEMEVRRRGFFPRGGGVVNVSLMPLAHGNRLPALRLAGPGRRGDVTSLSIRTFHAGVVTQDNAERMARAAKSTLCERIHALRSVPTDVGAEHVPPEAAVGDGGGVLIVARTAGGCVLGAARAGERGVAPEATGAEAAEELARSLEVHDSCVDVHLADQLVVFMALAEGRSEIATTKPTLHTYTAMHVARAMTGAAFSCQEGPGGVWTLACDGIGMAGRA
ncbi:unnamed protein product [Pedinophyceae sp. YPF-701]|nr:unnamed protein product [Pedinophyceae sp. YPF-701]